MIALCIVLYLRPGRDDCHFELVVPPGVHFLEGRLDMPNAIMAPKDLALVVSALPQPVSAAALQQAQHSAEAIGGDDPRVVVVEAQINGVPSR